MTNKEPSKVLQHQGRQERGNQMYTDYGYEVNGIEYATVDEAYED